MSDKLIMFHSTTLVSAGTVDYGLSIGTNQGRDLGVMFSRFLAEVALYEEDGAEIMIDNGWLEKPPRADNRKELVEKH